MIDYSVVIRTTGKANEKYQSLLNSIAKLEPQPSEIIVVLPEGNSLPKQRLGWESYYFCPKGMMIQRMTGIAKCKTRYALICDDDVVFEADFVKKLYAPIKEKQCVFSAGPLYSFLPPKGLNALLCTIMASQMPTLFHRKDRYISVLKSSGYSYNRHLDLEHEVYYDTQSVAWTCFFADVQALKKIKLEDETWLDKHGYSALDDQTMFYKAWLKGYKTKVVSNACYEHLDARTSTLNNKPAVLFSKTYNRVVFWHRFIYSQQKNMWNRIIAYISFGYGMSWMRLWDNISVLRKRMNKEEYQIAKQGYIAGWKYVHSEEYKNLPDLYRE